VGIFFEYPVRRNRHFRINSLPPAVPHFRLPCLLNTITPCSSVMIGGAWLARSHGQAFVRKPGQFHCPCPSYNINLALLAWSSFICRRKNRPDASSEKLPIFSRESERAGHFANGDNLNKPIPEWRSSTPFRRIFLESVFLGVNKNRQSAPYWLLLR